MAGVFSVAGVIALLIMVFATMKIMQRRARKRDEDEEEYFEKYQNEEPSTQASPHHNDSDYNLASATAMMPAHPDAYPDRTMHYGTEPAQEYETTQQYGNTQQYETTQQYGNTQQYEITQQYDYPPGTAYAAAAQSDGQYQYTRYQSSSPTSPHPFADPQNMSKTQAAPSIPRGHTQSVDAYGGIETGYAQ